MNKINLVLLIFLIACVSFTCHERKSIISKVSIKPVETKAKIEKENYQAFVENVQVEEKKLSECISKLGLYMDDYTNLSELEVDIPPFDASQGDDYDAYMTALEYNMFVFRMHRTNCELLLTSYE